MIIFYNKQTGSIAGTIQGRIHSPEELKMWHGTPDENDRLVIEWVPSKWETDEEGNIKVDEHGNKVAIEFEPDIKDPALKQLFHTFESNPLLLQRGFKVDLTTKKITEKTPEDFAKERQELEAKSKKSTEDKEIQDTVAIMANDPNLPLEERFDSLLAYLDMRGISLPAVFHAPEKPGPSPDQSPVTAKVTPQPQNETPVVQKNSLDELELIE